MLNFTNAEFILSAPRVEQKPALRLPEVIFVGKSNVGKSSLINALTGRKSLAYTSSKPGFTKLLNYYMIDKSFYLVDAPGYGYAAKGRRDYKEFAEMMEGYFNENKDLRHVFMLVDSRHEPSEDDKIFLEYILHQQVSYTLVITKVDKLNQSGMAAINKNLSNKFGFLPPNRIYVSSFNGKNIKELRDLVSVIVK
jgi:GTP-binding protein